MLPAPPTRRGRAARAATVQARPAAAPLAPLAHVVSHPCDVPHVGFASSANPTGAPASTGHHPCDLSSTRRGPCAIASRNPAVVLRVGLDLGCNRGLARCRRPASRKKATLATPTRTTTIASATHTVRVPRAARVNSSADITVTSVRKSGPLTAPAPWAGGPVPSRTFGPAEIHPASCARLGEALIGAFASIAGAECSQPGPGRAAVRPASANDRETSRMTGTAGAWIPQVRSPIRVSPQVAKSGSRTLSRRTRVRTPGLPGKSDAIPDIALRSRGRRHLRRDAHGCPTSRRPRWSRRS